VKIKLLDLGLAQLHGWRRRAKYFYFQFGEAADWLG
jgi:hypothetical protein